MNVKNEILEELRSLSAVVAAIGRENPYRVPDGYFSDLAVMILQRIEAPAEPELARVAGLEATKPLTFSVPDGYFDGFAQQVLNRIKSGAGPGKDVSDAGKQVSVPDELPAILMQAGRNMPYQVPEGYFDGLSPVLAVVREKNPYTVPAGYFDGLAAEVSVRRGAKTAAEAIVRPVEAPVRPMAAESAASRPARVVGMGRRMNWLKYSAAAVVAGLILAVGWLRLQTGKNGSRPGMETASAEIPKNLSKVSDEDLQSFLADQDTTLAQPVQNNASTATLDMNDSDVKSLLGDVPDGELKQYMEEHGGATDVATN